MSLTEKTQKHIASLNEQYKTIREFVFQEFDENELTEFTTKLATLKTRLEKACVRADPSTSDARSGFESDLRSATASGCAPTRAKSQFEPVEDVFVGKARIVGMAPAPRRFPPR